MSTTYIDARKLKQQLVMDSSIVSTNKGQLIPIQKVLDCIDFAMANYSGPNLTESPLNIKKYQRRLHRAKQHCTKFYYFHSKMESLLQEFL